MLKKIMCSLPLPIKIALGKGNTLLNNKKRKAINKISEMQSTFFPELNTPQYKNNLRKYLYACNLTADETYKYINYLYTDEVRLIHQGRYQYGIPTIICVVKNEADKLEAFFNHYNKLGEFNYIFIDNGSTDMSVEIIRNNEGTVYLCLEPFSTIRKISWINKVYSTLKVGEWSILLDTDELLVYDNYEIISINDVLKAFDKNNITTGAAIMIDMFSNKPSQRESYIDNYVYFENCFHEEKSFFFNSIYGGIREREFKFKKGRIFLIKKHPVVKKEEDTMLIHCHYIYPFKRNFQSQIYFGLLHYKLFDSEFEKYKKFAQEGNYADESIEYKNYMKAFADKTYEQIFAIGKNTELYNGTESLKKINCLQDVGEIMQ